MRESPVILHISDRLTTVQICLPSAELIRTYLENVKLVSVHNRT